MKETVHRWIDSFPGDHPCLRELYEDARLSLAIDEAEKSLAEYGGIPIEEVIREFEERCRKRLSA